MNTWSLSWHGVRTVVSLEVRQRLRSRRWFIALVAWFVFIGAITGLVMWAVYSAYSYNCSEYGGCSLRNSGAGPTAFGFITLFILGMGLVIAPTFTATAINSDRAQGTLAILQATRLSTVEILAGKLIAAWGTLAVFLVVALPFIVVTMIYGDISVWQVAVCFLVMFAVVAIVCAIGLGWSSLFTRAAASTVMTYLSVFVMAIISPIVMLFSLLFMEQDTTVRVWGLSRADEVAYNLEIDRYWQTEWGQTGNDLPIPTVPVDRCQWSTRTEALMRTDLVWWLLVPNPFLVVADAAPGSIAGDDYLDDDSSPLALLSYAVREAARGPDREVDDCLGLYYRNPAYEVRDEPDGSIAIFTRTGIPVPLPVSPVEPRPDLSTQPIWPWGLGVNLVIGAGFFYLAARKLTIPYARLTQGTRVA